MEMEFFIKPDEAEEAKWFDYWVEHRVNWFNEIRCDQAR